MVVERRGEERRGEERRGEERRGEERRASLPMCIMHQSAVGAMSTST
jgi:hypothetical protein